MLVGKMCLLKLFDIFGSVVSIFGYTRRLSYVSGAGNLEIIVAVNGRNVPNYVQSEGNARFKVRSFDF